MALINVPVPTLTAGISQQPASQRFSSQAALQENAWPSVVDGLTKRHPLDAAGKLFTGAIGEPLVHFINRDLSERYVMLLNPGAARVHELNGTQVPIYGPGGIAADFSYLALTTPDDIPGSTTFAVADGWVIFTTFFGGYGSVASGIVGPLGVGQWRRIGTPALSGAPQRNTFQLGKFVAGPQTFSVYFKRDDEIPLVQSNAVALRLGIDDTTNTLEHSVQFVWQVDGSLRPGLAMGGAVGHVSQEPNGGWRAWVTFQPGTLNSGITAAGNNLRVGVWTDDASISEDRTVLAYGARFDLGTIPGDYFDRPSRYLKALTIADYTLVLNTKKTAAMAGTLSPADPNARKAFLFVQASSHKQNYNVSLQRSGGTLNVVQQSTWDGNTSGNVKNIYTLNITAVGTVATVWSWASLGSTATYTVIGGDTTNSVAAALRTAINALPNVSATVLGTTVTITGDYEGQPLSPVVTPSTGGTFTLTEVQTAVSLEGNTIKTDDIATQLAAKINALSGFTGSSFGSVVKITSSTDITVLDVSDSFGDSNLIKIHKTVKSVSDLPLVCEHNFKVAIVGQTDDTSDDYFTSFTADDGSGFGNGKWIESNGHAITTTMDAATLPFQLVRKQDDVAGTVTGTPYAKYFEWGPAVWAIRLVGDNNSAPVPSLIGQKIQDIFFFKNRLGMLAGQNVVMSEAGRYFNLFRTTVLALPDADPIDIAVPHTSVVTLKHAVPFDETLVLFSDFTQFVLNGDPILSPKTVQTASKMEYDNLSFCRPLATERGVFFGAQRGEFTAVLDMKLDQTSNTGDFVADPISAAIPKYIRGSASQFAASSLEDVLMVMTDGDREALYVYNYFTQETQKLQSAWHRYTFDAKVLGIGFFETSLYVVLQHDSEVWLARSVITAGRVDDGADYLTHLDRRVVAGPDTPILGIYNITTDRTTWVVPYRPDVGDTVQVVFRATEDQEGGQVLSARQIGNNVSVDGDYTTNSVWIGRQYVMRYRFSRPSLKSPADNGGGKVLIAAGRYQLQYGTIVYSDSAYFRVAILAQARAPFYATFQSFLLGSAVLGELNLDSGKYRFGISSRADTTDIEITNDSPLPCKLESAEWEANYNVKSRRFQG